MAYNVPTPVYTINKYTWSILQEYLEWNAADYSDITPIVPSEQEEKLLATNKPFIVYGWAYDSGDVLSTTEQVAYSIYSNSNNSVSEINQVLNLLKGAFEREAETAKDINAVENSTGGFKTVSIAGISGPEPEESSGGRRAGVIIIRYTYGQDTPFNTV